MNWLTKKHNENDELAVFPVDQRAEKLAQMGAELCALRQENGFSLDEVAMMTKISRRLLQAIEEGNLDELPEPIYIQGFIRQFADALGLNGVEFASSFPVGWNRISLKPAWKSSGIGQLRPIHLYVIYVCLIFLSVAGLSQLLNHAILQANNTPVKQKLPLQPVVYRQSEIKSQEVQVGVTLKQKSWIKIVADGKVKYQGELPQGSQRTWKAEQELTVTAGNAGGVLISVNKQNAKQLGEPGKSQELTIAAAN